ESGRIVQSGSPEEIVLNPADDYVRDFISNVNPLSVLTAWNVMRDRRDLEAAGDDWLWLDRRRTTRIRVDAQGLVTQTERDGKASAWLCSDPMVVQADGGNQVYWARPATSLKAVIQAMHQSQTAPVALLDEQLKFVGAIDVRDAL